MTTKPRSARAALSDGLTPVVAPTVVGQDELDDQLALNAAKQKKKKKSPLDEVHNLPPPDEEELKAQKPLPKWREYLLIFVRHWIFDSIISIFTLIFAGILASYDINALIYPDQNKATINAYTSCQTMVVAFFTLEAFLKLLAFGIRSRKAKSASELDAIFEHDPHAAKKLLTGEELGKINDVFNLFDITKKGTINRHDLRTASRALDLKVEIGSEEEAILQRPGPDVLDMNDFTGIMSLVLTRGSELPGYFASLWNWYSRKHRSLPFCALTHAPCPALNSSCSSSSGLHLLPTRSAHRQKRATSPPPSPALPPYPHSATPVPYFTFCPQSLSSYPSGLSPAPSTGFYYHCSSKAS